jgi:hypothetical protein
VTTLSAFVDAEAVLRTLLAANFSPPRVGVVLPADLADQLPFIRVVRIGGPVTGVRTEVARVDVDFFAANRPDAKAGARAVQFFLTNQAAGTTVTLDDGSAGVVLSVACPSGPAWLPYANPNVFRFGAHYAVAVQTAA